MIVYIVKESESLKIHHLQSIRLTERAQVPKFTETLQKDGNYLLYKANSGRSWPDCYCCYRSQGPPLMQSTLKISSCKGSHRYV